MVPNSAWFAGKYGDGLITVGGEEQETYREIFANSKRERKRREGIQVNAAYDRNWRRLPMTKKPSKTLGERLSGAIHRADLHAEDVRGKWQEVGAD